MADTKSTLATIRIKAMNLLAQREYGVIELEKKLSSHFPDSELLIPQILSDLQQEGLLSDQRFAESFVNARINKGHGPIRIRHELKLRGISENIIASVLASEQTDWVALARRVYVKKFGVGKPDFQQRAKVDRFLRYRGFSHHEINDCLEDSS